jgi:hypothetical protein
LSRGGALLRCFNPLLHLSDGLFTFPVGIVVEPMKGYDHVEVQFTTQPDDTRDYPPIYILCKERVFQKLFDEADQWKCPAAGFFHDGKIVRDVPVHAERFNRMGSSGKRTERREQSISSIDTHERDGGCACRAACPAVRKTCRSRKTRNRALAEEIIHFNVFDCERIDKMV